jgi:HlyD family secretion protein
VLLRPDLSATAEIVTDTRVDVIALPIIALTVRPDSVITGQPAGQIASNGTAAGDTPTEIEGVFLVREGKVVFTQVELGIAGQEYFEALTGVQVGDTVVAGPYQAVRDLRNGDPVRPSAITTTPSGG